jgi:hypothetical protein
VVIATRREHPAMSFKNRQKSPRCGFDVAGASIRRVAKIQNRQSSCLCVVFPTDEPGTCRRDPGRRARSTSWRNEPPRRRFQAHGDERAVCSAAHAAGRGPFARIDGRISCGAAIGDEEDLVVPAFGGAALGRATRVHHADRRPWRTGWAGRSSGSSRALRTGGAGRAWIALLALRALAATDETQGDRQSAT